MPAPKSERLLNLLIMLLVQRRPIAKEQIRELLYAGSKPDAFEKMFERDKEELRSLGVPVEVAQIDPLFDDEVGYRIPVDQFALPDVALTAEEAAVVGLASRVWQHATMAQATSDAVRKLSAAGVGVDLGALDIAQPQLTPDEPAFETCWEAVCERTEIQFDYIRSGSTDAKRRRVQPWGVVRYSGRWYVAGYDTTVQDERIFRLSRVQGSVRKVGPPGAYEIPPDVDARAMARRLGPPPVTQRAVILAREGTGHVFRRSATSIDAGVPGPDTRTAWDCLVLDQPSDWLPDALLSHGADVFVVEPPELRERVVGRLRRAVGVTV